MIEELRDSKNRLIRFARELDLVRLRLIVFFEKSVLRKSEMEGVLKFKEEFHLYEEFVEKHSALEEKFAEACRCGDLPKAEYESWQEALNYANLQLAASRVAMIGIDEKPVEADPEPSYVEFGNVKFQIGTSWYLPYHRRLFVGSSDDSAKDEGDEPTNNLL